MALDVIKSSTTPAAIVDIESIPELLWRCRRRLKSNLMQLSTFPACVSFAKWYQQQMMRKKGFERDSCNVTFIDYLRKRSSMKKNMSGW